MCVCVCVCVGVCVCVCVCVNCSHISERGGENRSARTHTHDGGLTFAQLHGSLKQNLQRMAEKLDKGRG